MVPNDVLKVAVMRKLLPCTVAHGQKCQERPPQPLQAPRRPDAKQPTHHNSQIVRGHLHQVALRYLRHPIQPTTPTTTGLAHVCETPLDAFAPQPLQTFAPFALDAPPIAPVGLLLLCWLVRPRMLVLLLY